MYGLLCHPRGREVSAQNCTWDAGNVVQQGLSRLCNFDLLSSTLLSLMQALSFPQLYSRGFALWARLASTSRRGIDLIQQAFEGVRHLECICCPPICPVFPSRLFASLPPPLHHPSSILVLLIIFADFPLRTLLPCPFHFIDQNLGCP